VTFRNGLSSAYTLSGNRRKDRPAGPGGDAGRPSKGQRSAEPLLRMPAAIERLGPPVPVRMRSRYPRRSSPDRSGLLLTDPVTLMEIFVSSSSAAPFRPGDPARRRQAAEPIWARQGVRWFIRPWVCLLARLSKIDAVFDFLSAWTHGRRIRLRTLQPEPEVTSRRQAVQRTDAGRAFGRSGIEARRVKHVTGR